MPSIKTNFSLKADDIDKLKHSILRCGSSSEEAINNYLHNEAGEKIAKSITNFIPRSSRKDVIHAKDRKWWQQDNYNLAVATSNSVRGKRGKSFYYLYYVATGTGTNKKKGARDFMKKGMNKEYNNIVNGLVDAVENNINKELNK